VLGALRPQPTTNANARIASRREQKNKTDTPLRGMPATHTRQERLPPPAPPSEVLNVARTKVVSWLRAIHLTFPAAFAASGTTSGCSICPLQWRGRTGLQPVSVAPVRVRL
jgi:hypothetical protein